MSNLESINFSTIVLPTPPVPPATAMTVMMEKFLIVETVEIVEVATGEFPAITPLSRFSRIYYF